MASHIQMSCTIKISKILWSLWVYVAFVGKSDAVGSTVARKSCRKSPKIENFQIGQNFWLGKRLGYLKIIKLSSNSKNSIFGIKKRAHYASNYDTQFSSVICIGTWHKHTINSNVTNCYITWNSDFTSIAWNSQW